MAPHPGGPPGAQFGYHGRSFNRVQVAPFIYPRGWGYRRWAVGVALPPVFLVPDYYYTDWATLGLEPPPPGFQWVRYGPDLLLVNVEEDARGRALDSDHLIESAAMAQGQAGFEVPDRWGLDRKVAIVTGGGAAGDGIGNGRAFAILLARAGTRVVVVAGGSGG